MYNVVYRSVHYFYSIKIILFCSEQGLAKQLSQALLRGVCERTYEKPLNLLPSSPMISSTSSLKAASKTDLKATTINVITHKYASFSLKPQMYSGDRYYNPFILITCTFFLSTLDNFEVINLVVPCTCNILVC